MDHSGASNKGGDQEFLRGPAVEMASAIARREVSSVELVTAFLQRISDRDGPINAFVTVDAERALTEAAAVDERTRNNGSDALPPLHGIPIGIKDITPTRGMRTTFGSRAFADHIPDFDSETVERIRRSGMIVVGKTNTPEFAGLPFTDSDIFGPCSNPWDTTRNAGGSSGGAAAALAAEMIPISHATDAGASIRVPAAWCGVWGLKPSRGRISLSPQGERLAGIASEGPIARTVTDLAAFLDAVSGYAWGDPHWAAPPERPFAHLLDVDPGRLRVLVATDSPLGSQVDRECLAVVEKAATLLSDLGHDVQRGPFNWESGLMHKHIPTIWGTLNAYYGNPDPSLLTEYNRRRRPIGALEYVEARLALEKMARLIVRQWESIDLLLTLTVSMPAAPNEFLSGQSYDEEIKRIVELVSFTRQFSVTGQPAVSVPMGVSESGLPLAVQLVGPPAGDALVLQVAHQLEQFTRWQPAGVAVAEVSH